VGRPGHPATVAHLDRSPRRHRRRPGRRTRARRPVRPPGRRPRRHARHRGRRTVIRYVTKYITKHTGDCHKLTTDRQRHHLDRLWQQLQITPCNDRCANWLLFGVQPKKAHAKLKPGRCKGKVHQRDTLGIGGRRILISRDWSGKTLADHKHDAKAWVRALLGVTTDPATAPPVDDQGDTAVRATHVWELARPDDPDVMPVAHRLMRSISERARWRSELLAAKDRAAQGQLDLSATGIAA
jgi:hypothetical protein